MKKSISNKQKKEMLKKVQKNGFLTKEEVLFFSNEFNINVSLFIRLLKKEKIPFINCNLKNILIAYSIPLVDNKVELNNFLTLGEWKTQIFKNSKIKTFFICERCNEKENLALRNLITRKYFSLKPICGKCINNSVTSSEEWLHNNSVAQKECKNRIEIKENYSSKIKDVWKKDGYRDHISNKMKERWKTDVYRENVRVGVFKKYGYNNAMQNEKVFKKGQKSSFKFKDYIMPSGKKIQIQGFEDLALTVLLKKYEENDLIIGVKNIQKKIGKIFYIENGVQRRYYPDIYIESENKIIEVKSNWTYKKSETKNNLKKQKCLELNFQFAFMIFFNRKSVNFVEEL